MPPVAAAQTQQPPPAGEMDIIARCLAGDSDALASLVEQHQAGVFGLCLRITRNREMAVEATNSVFYKAYRSLHTFDASRPLRPWLLRIATNEALNLLRAHQRDRERRVEATEDLDPMASLPAPDDPAAGVVAAERAAAVRAAVAALPERYRLIIVLRYFNDLSYSEIAEQAGIPVNSIGVMLLRARNLLRRALSDEDEDHHGTASE